MPMRESLQLAAELTKRHGHTTADADWRPLLRYAAGNPLTITVLVSQALRENLTTAEDVDGFVTRLRAGEAQLEQGKDAALGRTRSLAASLSYGFAQAFNSGERAQLAVLHLFRDTVQTGILLVMGDQEAFGQEGLPELAAIGPDTVTGLLERAAEIGLLTSVGDGYYLIHPALPWYFTTLFTDTYGQASTPAAERAARAYAFAFGMFGHFCAQEVSLGRSSQIVPRLRVEEANLHHAMDLALAAELWTAAIGCLQGLKILYERTGRDAEWARLVDSVTPDFTRSDTGGPLPGREEEWIVVANYRARLAEAARDWPAATVLQDVIVEWTRDQAREALDVPAEGRTEEQRSQINNVAVSLIDLGDILTSQGDAGGLSHYREAIALYQQIGDQNGEAVGAGALGNAFLRLHEEDYLDQAEHWFRHSLGLLGHDRVSRSKILSSLGAVALERFAAFSNADDTDDFANADDTKEVPLGHLNAAMSYYQQALDLTPADDHEARSIREHQLGNTYARAGDTRQALRHYQQSIVHEEARGNSYGAGQSRQGIAILLAADGRASDALQYARAALGNYRQVGPGAAADARQAEQLIADLERAGG
jgi:tetratricopeptide (TPR) repeat protein